MCPREESNFDQRLRSPLFYPLNYGGLYGQRLHYSDTVLELQVTYLDQAAQHQSLMHQTFLYLAEQT